MTFNDITLKKRLQILAQNKSNCSNIQKAQIQAEAMRLGFIFTVEALDYIDLDIYSSTFGYLNHLVGGDNIYQPFYPNFPQEVIDQSESDLFWNNFVHYLTAGQWRPDYSPSTRLPVFESVNFKTIGLAHESALTEIYSSIVTANIALPETDTKILDYFLKNWDQKKLLEITPKPIPFKEISSFVVKTAFDLGYLELCDSQIRTATDALRVATGFSGGDISLAKNAKFKLSNKQKKFIVNLLEVVINKDEIAKHQNKWVRLFHCLHIGTFKNATKSNQIAKQTRETKLSNSYNSAVEKAIIDKDVFKIADLADKNAGDIIRRLDKILRQQNNLASTDYLLEKIINKTVNTRVLIQAYNHFLNRDQSRLVISKSGASQAKILPAADGSIDTKCLENITQTLKEMIRANIETKSKEKIFVDTSLKLIPMPTSMRNISDGLLNLPRGARLEIFNDSNDSKTIDNSSKNGFLSFLNSNKISQPQVLRFFIWWTSSTDEAHSDLDLSSGMLDDKYNFVSQVSYTNLKNNFAYHSGDLTSVKSKDTGSCEFIDIDLTKIPSNVRYLTLDVRKFGGDILRPLTGWMMRQEVGNFGELFDPKTVQNCIALGDFQTKLACLFDLVEKKMIWMDINGSFEASTQNSLENNTASIRDFIQNFAQNKPISIYDFISLKFAQNLTENQGEATLVYDLKSLQNFQQIIDLID